MCRVAWRRSICDDLAALLAVNSCFADGESVARYDRITLNHLEHTEPLQHR
jgi:hypothetical protein